MKTLKIEVGKYYRTRNGSIDAGSSQTDVAPRYYHPCVGVGLFVKEYVGRYGRGMVVRLDNGREWFAPINEFTLIR